MGLIDLCVRRPVFATMLAVGLVVLGLASYRELGLDAFPKVDFPTVTITTRLPGASPEEIEGTITKKIEEVVNTINGLDELRSVTTEGQAQIFATFVLERNINDAANDVREKVSAIASAFPPGAEAPAIEKFDPDAAPILAIVISGQRPAREVTEIADKRIKRPLENVRDIGAITLVGDRRREIQLLVDPYRLAAMGLAIQQVKEAVLRQNVEIPGGNITAGAREQGLRTLGRIERAEDFDDLIVADRRGAPVRIRDIGRAVDGEEEPRTLSRLDGRSAVSLLVQRQSGTNTVQVVERVKAKLAEIRPGLPPDIEFQVVRDLSRFIRRGASEVQHHLLLGSLLASLIVWAFLGLRHWRPALIAAVAIPVSIIATFTVMRLAGFTLNNLTMLGLSVSVGIVIDDAIIVLENIFRHMEEEALPPAEAAVVGGREIALAVMATTLSLVVIFLPVAFMSGLVGRFWNSFGLTATFAILVSLLVAFSLTPMLAARFLKPPGGGAARPARHGGDGRRFGRIERAYERLLAWCLGHRALVLLAALALMASTVLLSRYAKVEFVVDDDMSEFEIAVETPPGSSLAESDRILQGIEAELRQIPEVQHLFTTIGVRGKNRANVTDAAIYVGLTHMRQRARTQREIMQAARQRLAQFPGIRSSVQQLSLIQGGGFKQTPFNLVLRGPELPRLDDIAQAIIQRLAARPGFVDLDTGQGQRRPEVQVAIDRRKASDLGVRVDAIASALRTMVGGEKVGFYQEGGEQYDVRLRLQEAYRAEASAIAELRVPGAGGSLIPLTNLVRLVQGPAPAQIDRFNQERQVTVQANLHGKPLGQAIQEANAVARELGLPPGYTTAYLGRGKLLGEALHNFLIAFVLSLVFIYMVLAAQFESFLHPVTIMVSMFLSLPFGVARLLAAGSTLNIYSIMGLFLLMGVVKKNAILQVDYTNVLRARGLDRQAAQLQADRARLRPILMTTLAIIAGMLPVALGRGDGSASRASMATAVVGGQALCLAVTLLVTPVVYAFFDDLRGLRAGVPRPSFAWLRERLAWAAARLANGRTR
jgi:HAE1 family hydrophobic/amphiphilic exporter-1